MGQKGIETCKGNIWLQSLPISKLISGADPSDIHKKELLFFLDCSGSLFSSVFLSLSTKAPLGNNFCGVFLAYQGNFRRKKRRKTHKGDRYPQSLPIAQLTEGVDPFHLPRQRSYIFVWAHLVPGFTHSFLAFHFGRLQDTVSAGPFLGLFRTVLRARIDEKQANPTGSFITQILRSQQRQSLPTFTEMGLSFQFGESGSQFSFSLFWLLYVAPLGDRFCW